MVVRWITPCAVRMRMADIRAACHMMRSVTTHDQGLPEYERPPVVEVALAVQLDRAVGYKAHHLAEIAHRWEDEYPNVEERTPLPTMGFGSDNPDLTLDASD